MQDGQCQARIARLVELRRARAALDAEEARILHALATDPPQVYLRPDPEGDKQWVRDEVSCVLMVAPVTAAAKLAEACELVERLPATLKMLDAGEITAPHAGRLVEATFGLSDETVAAVEQRVLKRVSEQTPSQFRASVRRAVLALAPRERDEQRRAHAIAQRRVCATLARALAFEPTGTWRRLLTDEVGQVSDAGPAYPAPPPHHHRSYWASEPRSETQPDQHAMSARAKSPPAATRPERQRGAA